jgi:hypothetical protein
MTGPAGWLLLVHHLPPRPTRLRVRVWRQLQKIGAVAVKSSVYVLPWSERTLEDFTWLQQEIASGGGEAVVLRAAIVAGATDQEVIASFRRERDAAYARLTADMDRLSRRIASRRRGEAPAPADRVTFEKEVEAMQRELINADEVDFFRAPGRARAAAALDRCRGLLRPARDGRPALRPRGRAKPAPLDTARYQGRLGVTRPRPHIDRCASAWLIRRFIDRRPRFAFVAAGGNLRGGIPYDMPGAELGHQGEDCTFETLVKQFGLEGDGALRAIAEIVHDVDLKDSKFGRSESAGLAAVLRGLAEATGDDQRLLREAGAIFDGLYATLGSRPSRGRKNASRRRR